MTLLTAASAGVLIATYETDATLALSAQQTDQTIHDAGMIGVSRSTERAESSSAAEQISSLRIELAELRNMIEELQATSGDISKQDSLEPQPQLALSDEPIDFESVYEKQEQSLVEDQRLFDKRFEVSAPDQTWSEALLVTTQQLESARANTEFVQAKFVDIDCRAMGCRVEVTVPDRALSGLVGNMLEGELQGVGRIQRIEQVEDLTFAVMIEKTGATTDSI